MTRNLRVQHLRGQPFRCENRRHLQGSYTPIRDAVLHSYRRVARLVNAENVADK